MIWKLVPEIYQYWTYHLTWCAMLHEDGAVQAMFHGLKNPWRG